MDQTPSPSFADQLVWLFFRLDGRISRATFLLAGLLLAVMQGFMLYRFTLAPQESGESAMWAMGFWAIGIVSIWCSFALGVKRLHDFGKPGILAVSLFIPVIFFVAFIALCAWPGDGGPNAYGPRTNARRTG